MLEIWFEIILHINSHSGRRSPSSRQMKYSVYTDLCTGFALCESYLMVQVILSISFRVTSIIHKISPAAVKTTWRIWLIIYMIWWRHEMETFSALLALCEGKQPVTGEFSSQRPVTRRFDVFVDLRLNKRLSKYSRHRWFETPSRSLWRHCNEITKMIYIPTTK